MYFYYRDEFFRVSWNYGEERGYEEFLVDGRNVLIERERFDDWDRKRYWRECERDY